MLKITKTGPSGAGRRLYVDAFILTVPDEGEITTGPSASSAQGVTSSVPTSQSTTREIVSSPSTSNLSTQSFTSRQSGTVAATRNVSGPSIEGNSGNGGGSSSNSDSAGVGGGPNTGNGGSSEMKSSTKAAIIGGTLGGLALVCIIAAILFYRRRRRQQAEMGPAIYETAEAGSSEATEPTAVASYNAIEGSHPSIAALRSKEMQERERIAAPSEASGSGSGSESAQQVQTSLRPSWDPLSGSTPVDKHHSSPGLNRMSIHREDWLSTVSRPQSWMLANPPAYTVRPIEGHVHAGGDTMSDY
ncbi:hypothetical protein FRC17_007119 [Serendipita sp. 399]|nr:hypothetical protein FRC17_007119 [Serendipita sp. 399]